MPAARKLNQSEIASELEATPGWTLQSGKLHREFSFPDFVSAFAFMTKAAMISEKKNHHPEWFNSYNVVRIELVTHSVQGISDKDFDWARLIDTVYTAS